MEESIKIDFVVLWVDPNNPEWQARYKQYRTENHPEDTTRYRDWGLLPYWFRAVEKYAPWVNKIYFVTSGELPDWLNLDYPKLVHVKHEDFIPAKYLPTFSARPIELNLHLIPGLSEHFVYFNDDMFLNAPIKPTYFFRKGLPCDAPCESLFSSPLFLTTKEWNNSLTTIVDVAVLNMHFNRHKTVKRSLYRWLGPYLGFWNVLSAILISRFRRFQGFRCVHQIQPFLKETFIDVWNKEFEWLDKTCSYKFRKDLSVNQWFLRFWQLARNKFYPSRHKNTCRMTISNFLNFEDLKNKLFDKKFAWICLNDDLQADNEKVEEIRIRLRDLFYSKLPQKSQFEK
jgi:hypothetical protein